MKPIIERDKKGHFVKGGENPYNFKIKTPKGGYWSSEDSISFQYKYLIKKTIDEFKRWMKENPGKERTIAQELAYQAVTQARKDLAYLKEVTDRTEGRASQSIDMTSGGKPIPLLDFTEKKK